MRVNLLPLLVAVALTASIGTVQAQSNDDPGASGVVDGSDVRQFLDSGARFSPVRMEEASRRFDKMIKLPPRVKKAKTWNEVIQRDNGLVNQNIAREQAAEASGNATTQGATQNGQKLSDNTAAGAKKPKKKHKLLKKTGQGLIEAAEFVGFPISDEFLPNDVDASLAGDLPDGDDPRVYVHPKKSKQQIEAQKELLDKAERRGASAEDVLPEGNGQAPALFAE